MTWFLISEHRNRNQIPRVHECLNPMLNSLLRIITAVFPGGVKYDAVMIIFTHIAGEK